MTIKRRTIKRRLADEIAKASAKQQQVVLAKEKLAAEERDLFLPIAKDLVEMKTELQSVEGCDFEIGANSARVKLGEDTSLDIWSRGLQYPQLPRQAPYSVQQTNYGILSDARVFSTAEEATNFILQVCAEFAARKAKTGKSKKRKTKTGKTKLERVKRV